MAEDLTRSEPSTWTPWVLPYEPRRVDSCDVIEDEHGRLIEYADCSIRCPRCGVCCAGHRDEITVHYGGTEEYEGNLMLKRRRGGLVK